MTDRTSAICSLFVLAIVVFGFAVVLSDDSHSDAELTSDASGLAEGTMDSEEQLSALNYSLEHLKSIVSGLVASAVDLIENKEDKEGETINIDKAVEVSEDTEVYNIGNWNTYVFSGNGSIDVKAGGTLRFGNDFIIKGEHATINLSKGAYVRIFGYSITVPEKMTLVLDGTLTSRFDLISDVSSFTMDVQLKGSWSLNGTMKAGLITIKSEKGSALEFDASLKVVLDPASVIKNIKHISDHIFEDENGVEVTLTLNRLKAAVDSTLCDVNVDVTDAKIEVASPLYSSSLIIEEMEITKISVNVDYKYSMMNGITLNVSNVRTDHSSDPVRFRVADAKFVIDTISKTICDVSINYGEFSIELGDRFHVMMFNGYMQTHEGELDLDLDIVENATLYTGVTLFKGRLYVEKSDSQTGAFNMRFLTYSRLIIGDDIDISFAGDEKATLQLMPAIELEVTIIPDDGYRLIEFQSDRYVEYTVDEVFHYGIPVSLKGIYHAELGERLYNLYLEESTVIEAYATQIVDLPAPEPQAGRTFVGWYDARLFYRETYEMPAHDVWLQQIWSDDNYTVSVKDGIYTVSTDNMAIVVKQGTMNDVKAMMRGGSVHTLRIIIEYGSIDVHTGTVLSIEGELAVNLSRGYAQDLPEIEKLIEGGYLFYAELYDDWEQIKELDDTISVTVGFESSFSRDNTVKAYYVNDLDRLTEVGCNYSFISAEEQTDVKATAETDHLPYIVFFTSYEKQAGGVKAVMLLSMIPVVLVGVVLAIITRKR